MTPTTAMPRRAGLVCVECGASVPELVRDYGKGNLRLAICASCNSVADKYVEYETVLLFLEVLLLKPQVYRHVLCNLPTPVAARTTLKLFVILVMLDMNVKAYLVDRDAGVTFRSESMYRSPEALQAASSGLRIGQFSLHLVCLALVENMAFFASVFAIICLDPFRRGWRAKLLNVEGSSSSDKKAAGTGGMKAAMVRYVSAMCISSFGKLFALLTVIWEYHWSFIHVIGGIVVVSNVLALQLLLGEGDPARAKSPHVVAVVLLGLLARGMGQLALYAMGNSMSAVELPLVATTRSAGSSASSTRGTLYSAGSIKSEKSALSVRSQRSQRSQQQEGDGDDEVSSDGGESGDEGVQEGDEPQEPSAGLWDEVEHFLNKPSPSLSTLAVGKTARNPPATSERSVLPSLNRKTVVSDNQKLLPSRPARTLTSSSSSVSVGAKTIDPRLLQEAFAYAHQVQQMSFDDDDGDGDEQQSGRYSKGKALLQRTPVGRSHSSSSSAPLMASTGSKKKGKTSSTSVYNSAAKPGATQKKKRSEHTEPQTNVTAKSKGHMDPQTLQALVTNFQNGTTLEELRKELAASQQSMAMSRQVLQEAAQTFFQPSH
ncbi:hypothetical protein BBJ28_00008973 [Nothophytophthora sp. Chile5]|nr:hypothetical protein BBJ28_00008973 [Nothophytophthora sp. Chile5]